MLKGKLTRIRPLELEDLEQLYEWYNEPEFAYWVCGKWPLATFIRRDELERKMYEDDENRYAITELENNNLIGTIGFDQVNIPARSARLYLGLGDSRYWGKGYGFDCLTVFIEYLFQQWNFRRLTAETWQLNTRAISCYEKLGFLTEGKLREAYYVNGNYYDAVILGLLKDDFSGFKNNSFA